MEYNDNTPQSKLAQSSSASRFEETASIPAAPLSTVLQRLGLHTSTSDAEMPSPDLLVNLAHTDQSERAAAIQALEKRGHPLPIEPLLSVLQHDPVWSVRALAALALRVDSEHVPLAPLLNALHDEDEAVRAAVVRLLGTMGERAPLPTLQRTLADPSWSVREAALLSLAELGQNPSGEIRRGDPRGRPLVNQGHRRATPRVAPTVQRKISRRAMMVGVATIFVAGNSIIWSLLLRSLHNRQLPRQTFTGNGSRNIAFYGPGYSALDSRGQLYVLDEDEQGLHTRILKLSPTGNVLTEWRFTTGAQPTCLAIDTHDNAYVCVQGTNTIYQLVPTGNLLKAWQLTGKPPTSLAFDTHSNFYVAHYDDDTIQKYNARGTLLTSWGGPGQFYHPTTLAIDEQGHLYIADQGNNRIQKLTSTATAITSWGTSGTGQGHFLQLGTIALDKQGNIYATDGDSGLVQKFSATGTLLAVWGASIPGTVDFGIPRGIAVDIQGNIYVSSVNSNGATFTHGRITVLSPAGKLVAVWK